MPPSEYFFTISVCIGVIEYARVPPSQRNSIIFVADKEETTGVFLCLPR